MILIVQFSVSGQVKVSEHLKALESFANKTWKGEFVNTKSGNTVKDVAKWEYTLNGKAIRILHSVNDGAYGGETIIIWDEEKEKLIFFYFTTDGFFTNGNVNIEGNKMTAVEIVKGNKDGITQVNSVSEILPDGRMHTQSQLLKNGEWIDGHEIFYSEDPDAEVIFKEIIE